MKPETIEFIREKLQTSVEIAENSMMYAIRSSGVDGVDGVSPDVEERVKKYQEAYRALKDFEEWADEQEEDE